tara:strand:+ start:240 stop:686 length:447 start_codon:yes stop_codon:yes gene_type:complete
MSKEEFDYFCTQCNQAYPKQLVMNETEKNFMAVAIRDYTVKDCMNALALHVQKSEWRPKVCDITKYLQQSDQQILNTFQMFFDRKEVADKRAVDIYRRMGGLKLNKMSITQLEDKKELFLSLYKQGEAEEKFDELPKSIQNKLIGIIK